MVTLGSLLTCDIKPTHWLVFTLIKSCNEQVIANGTAKKVLLTLCSSEAGYGYLALKATFGKTRRVEDMVIKICVREKKGRGTCKERRNRKGRKGEGKQESAYLKTRSCHVMNMTRNTKNNQVSLLASPSNTCFSTNSLQTTKGRCQSTECSNSWHPLSFLLSSTGTEATGYNTYLPPAPCLRVLFLATPAHPWCTAGGELVSSHHSKNLKSNWPSYAVLPASSIRRGLESTPLPLTVPAVLSFPCSETLTHTQTDLNYPFFCCTRSRMCPNVQILELMLLREHRRSRTSM